MARDFHAAVAAVLADIPASETSLHIEIERAYRSACYQAPECFTGWHDIGHILTRALGRQRGCEWADRVYEIWTGKQKEVR